MFEILGWIGWFEHRNLLLHGRLIIACYRLCPCIAYTFATSTKCQHWRGWCLLRYLNLIAVHQGTRHTGGTFHFARGQQLLLLLRSSALLLRSFGSYRRYGVFCGLLVTVNVVDYIVHESVWGASNWFWRRFNFGQRALLRCVGRQSLQHWRLAIVRVLVRRQRWLRRFNSGFGLLESTWLLRCMLLIHRFVFPLMLLVVYTWEVACFTLKRCLKRWMNL